DEDRMERKVVGQIIQARGKQEAASLADLLVQQYRGVVGQACDDTYVRVIDAHDVVELHACQVPVLAHGGVRRVGLSRSEESLVTPRDFARVIVNVLDRVSEDRNAA